jgi:nicotinamide mononucleotide transporter
VFGLLKENILVYPTGLINTSIYAYLYWHLLGDMINAYFFVMSIWMVQMVKKKKGR